MRVPDQRAGGDVEVARLLHDVTYGVDKVSAESSRDAGVSVTETQP